MRSLRERLAQFDRPAAPAAPPSAAPLPLESVLALGARWVGDAPHGYLRRELDLVFDRPRARTLPPEAWRRMGVEPPEAEGDWLVLDTETTGLEGGTGTLVFLVGLVRWGTTGARLVQLLMPEPAGEPALLEAVARELDGAAAIVSYNGRGFDVPRLRARMRLQRMDVSVLERPHLDLLHPARRLVRSWLSDCRLGSVEREVLGRARVDDLPGSEAPEVYRTLLAERRDIGLDRVVRHNAIDVESLLELGAWLSAAHLAHDQMEMPPPARIALGRALAARGEADEARGCLERAVAEGDGPARRQARWHLAQLLRRSRLYEQARDVLVALLDEQPGALDAHVELAKLYEHRLKDPASAHDVVLRALRVDQERRALGLDTRPGRARTEALTHRLHRLQRRMGRQSAERPRRRRDGGEEWSRG